VANLKYMNPECYWSRFHLVLKIIVFKMQFKQVPMLEYLPTAKSLWDTNTNKDIH
jgi:hypothetical protein